MAGLRTTSLQTLRPTFYRALGHRMATFSTGPWGHANTQRARPDALVRAARGEVEIRVNRVCEVTSG